MAVHACVYEYVCIGGVYDSSLYEKHIANVFASGTGKLLYLMQPYKQVLCMPQQDSNSDVVGIPMTTTSRPGKVDTHHSGMQYPDLLCQEGVALVGHYIPR